MEASNKIKIMMKKFIMISCGAIVFLTQALSSVAQQKPNILWITIEDTSPQFIGCYGNKDARTPNIDKLAAEGVRFTNAFSTNTVCSPSRTTIITGVRTFENGTGNHRSSVPVPRWMQGFPSYMQKAGYYVTNNVKTDYNIQNKKAYIANTWNESSESAGWWTRKPGQPFFAVFNYVDSHQSRTMTYPYREYEERVLSLLNDDEKISENAFSMPPFYRDSPEMRKQFARVYNSIKLTDKKIGELLQRLEKDHLTDSTIIFFFGDHGEGIPRGKTNGINLGYRVPFVVWFPPMYRNLSPWGTGTVTDELVDFEDLAPTLIHLTGADVPKYMKGRRLLGAKRSEPVQTIELSSDRSDNGIDMIRSITDGRYMYSRNYMPFMPEARYINYMEISEIKKIMRSDLAAGRLNPLQKSIFEPRPAEFLFDLKNDPWETKNLAGTAAAKPILEKMRKDLEERILKSADIMFLPEYSISKLAENPYEFRLNEEKYPFKEIYAAAKLSGFRGEDIALRQVKLLTDKDQHVRYWAILGLRSQPSSIQKKHESAIKRALQDQFAPVQITAAAIVCNIDPKSAVAPGILNKYASGTEKELALMALNYLLYTNNRKPFIGMIKTINANPDLSDNVKWASQDFLNHF